MNRVLKTTLLICVIIGSVLAFHIYAGAIDIELPVLNANQPDAFTIEELSIIPEYAILEGHSLQMQVE